MGAEAPGEFPPQVIELLTTFATQSALAIRNARLFQEIAEPAARGRRSAPSSASRRCSLSACSDEVREKQAEYLQDILSSGRHLLSLINDMLDLSKVEAGRLELEAGPLHLPTAIENAPTLVRERATRHGITPGRSVDARVGDIAADERKAKQILLNLLSNAMKFTPEGGRVRIAAGPSDGAVEISVSDTGIGIAPEDQAAVLEGIPPGRA